MGRCGKVLPLCGHCRCQVPRAVKTAVSLSIDFGRPIRQDRKVSLSRKKMDDRA